MNSLMTESTSSATHVAKASAAAPRYALDGAHSRVGFSVRHMMITNVRGEFRAVSGEATYDPKRPEATTLSVSIDVASIHTREQKRDAHLRSADFFDADSYPTITFVSKEVKAQADGVAVLGDLTIRGTTRKATLTVEDITPERSDPWGNKRIGATARTRILRSDFGMTWNTAIEAGGLLVGDEIKIEIEVELIRQA